MDSQHPAPQHRTPRRAAWPRRSIAAAMGLVLLATAGCTATGGSTDDDATQPAASTSTDASPSPSTDAADEVSVDGSFAFADGTTIGILASPWRTKATVDGGFLHLLPGAAGTFDDQPWGDLIAYVPDAAHASGAAAPEPVPADPVQWTASHGDLEILDQREVEVDGTAATQFDARAVTPTQWLSFGDEDLEWGGVERVVLIPLDGAWLVVRGSVFDEEVALAESSDDDGAFSVLLDSVDLPD